jgi:hypothetical protein
MVERGMRWDGKLPRERGFRGREEPVRTNGRQGGRPSSTDLSHLNPQLLGQRLTLLICLLLFLQRAVDDGVSIPVERGRSVNHPVPDHVTVRPPSISFHLA